MGKEKEGPEFREIPSQRFRVCGDCKYHKVQRMMCGHDYVTDNYTCTHPDAVKDIFPSIFAEGRTIAFNSRETPATPEWCPFLKQ